MMMLAPSIKAKANILWHVLLQLLLNFPPTMVIYLKQNNMKLTDTQTLSNLKEKTSVVTVRGLCECGISHIQKNIKSSSEREIFRYNHNHQLLTYLKQVSLIKFSFIKHSICNIYIKVIILGTIKKVKFKRVQICFKSPSINTNINMLNITFLLVPVYLIDGL